MESQEALDIVKQLVPDKSLSYVEEAVFLGTWEGKRYREMALELGYEEGYLKDTGSKLWRLLSDCLGKEVTKKRIRFILDEASCSEAIATPPASLQAPPLSHNIKFPGSPLPYGSPFYILRSPIEDLCTATLQQPGSLIRIKAPCRMGKTSLMNQSTGTARTLGMKTVFLDIRQADADVLADLDAFLRWFCWALSQQLELKCDFDKCWFPSAGSKLSCTTLVQEWLINQIKEPVVIAIDTVHHLVDYPHIASNFFSMLRAWYEKARVREEWQKLRLIMAYVNELDLPLELHQSPFNVGLLLEIPPFTHEQVMELARGYELPRAGLSDFAKLEPLFALIGGHPYLWHLAYYWLQSGHLSLAQLLEQAPTTQGIYREHLRYIGLKLQQDPDAVQAVQQMLTESAPVYLEQRTFDRLRELGLIQPDGIKATISCGLYREYFAPCLVGQRV